ncbi:hypothetical protein ABI59_04830 [Acidobacteria bacterium Mor1]|nr:hypothetical protein ABI59_04830 [Acidobacteria bacterium Mor1]
MTALQGTVGGRSRNSLLGATLCVGLAVVIASLSSADPGLVGLFITVAVLFVACFLPAVVGAVRGNLDYFEIVHLFGFIYFLNFGAAALWVTFDPSLAYDIHIVPYIPRAAFYALLGYLAFLAGYYGPWTKRLGKGPGRVHLAPRGTMFMVAVGGIGLVGYVVWAEVFRARYAGGSALTGLTSLLGQVAFFFVIVWGLTHLMLFSGKLAKTQKLVYLAFLLPAAVMIARANVSRKQLLLTLVLVPAVAFWYSRRRVPWVPLLVLFLIFVFIVFPIYNTVRFFDWDQSLDARLTQTFDRMRDWDRGEYMDQSVGSFQSRLALINSMAIVLRDVPRWEPYLQGESWVMAPAIILVPRILWPDKPELGIGLEFGQKFRVVNPQDNLTSIAPSLPGELYWEFDLPGILIGMGLIGFILRWVYARFCATSPVVSLDRSIYIYLLMRLMVIEGALLASSAFIIKNLLVLLILRWGCAKLGWLRPVEAPEAS